MFNFFKLLNLFIFLFFTASCLTTKKLMIKRLIRKAKDKTSLNVRYTPPPSPYVKKDKASLDAFWINTKNKSSISYFSNCSKETPYLSLKNIEEDSLRDVEYKIIEQKISSKHRYSVISTLEYKTINGIYTLKSSDCFFTINLISPSLAIFKKEESVFKRFTEGFKF